MVIPAPWAWIPSSSMLFGRSQLLLRLAIRFTLITSSIRVTRSTSRQSHLPQLRSPRGTLISSLQNLRGRIQSRATLVSPLTPPIINSLLLSCHLNSQLLNNLLLKSHLNSLPPTLNPSGSPILLSPLQVLHKWIRWGNTMSGASLIMLHLSLTSRTGISGWATASNLAVHCSPLTSLAGWFSTTRIACWGVYFLSLKGTSRCFSASVEPLNQIKRLSMDGRRWLILQSTLTSLVWIHLVLAKASPEVNVYIYISSYIITFNIYYL